MPSAHAHTYCSRMLFILNQSVNQCTSNTQTIKQHHSHRMNLTTNKFQNNHYHNHRSQTYIYRHRLSPRSALLFHTIPKTQKQPNRYIRSKKAVNQPSGSSPQHKCRPKSPSRAQAMAVVKVVATVVAMAVATAMAAETVLVQPVVWIPHRTRPHSPPIPRGTQNQLRIRPSRQQATSSKQVSLPVATDDVEGHQKSNLPQ